MTLLLCTVVNAAKVKTKQLHFVTPEEAVTALVTSVKENNHQQLIHILGDSAKPLIESGDANEDKSNREAFLKAYSEGNKLEKQDDSKFILTLGTDNWAFPIPIMKMDNEWYFDTNAGKEEILNRRIGRNELLTVQALSKHLNTKDSKPEFQANGNTQPYFGYAYRKLGENTFIAWPVTYGNTGIMTFIIDQDGNIHEKDLGHKTKLLVNKISHADNTWKKMDKPH